MGKMRLTHAETMAVADDLARLQDENQYLRTLLLNAVNEYPIASGIYVDQDGQAGYGSLKAMRLHLKIAPSRGFLHIPDPVGGSGTP